MFYVFIVRITLAIFREGTVLKKGKTRINSLFIFFFLFTFFHSQLGYSATPSIKPSDLPSTVNPEQVTRALLSEQPAAKPAVARAPIQEEEVPVSSAVGEQAKKITFKLKQIVLTGNQVYSDAELQALFQTEINKLISVADLFNIIQRITNYYRNNGYILSRAVLPPQHVQHGVVHVQIVEGFVNKVNVIGHPRQAEPLLERYGNRILQSRPLQLKVMEKYLLIMNEIPGVSTRAVLAASKETPGAADLNLNTQFRRFSGFFSYDNYGTRYIGPQQATANVGINSLVFSGDSSQLTWVKTPKGKELNFIDFNYNVPIGKQGLRWTLGRNEALTNPLYTLQSLVIHGLVDTWYTTVQYPLIRARTESVTLQAGFNYLDTRTTSFGALLYQDNIRPINFGGNYSFLDRFGGSNLMNLNVTQGLPLFGADLDPNSTTTSRFGATARFLMFDADVSHLQPMGKALSLFTLIKGQYAFQPLLASEQFAFGGSQLGRGYDPAEITGDNGLAGSAEVRLNLNPKLRFLQSIQLYVFYDAGAVWDIKQIVGTPLRQDAMSTGGGIRFTFNSRVSGNLMLAQPLTKKVAAQELIGQGSLPRSFFSIVAML